jgi:hypothetical protein
MVKGYSALTLWMDPCIVLAIDMILRSGRNAAIAYRWSDMACITHFSIFV